MRGAELMWTQLVTPDAEPDVGLEFLQLVCDNSIVRLLNIVRGSCLVEWPSTKREWLEKRHLRLPPQGEAELKFTVAQKKLVREPGGERLVLCLRGAPVIASQTGTATADLLLTHVVGLATGQTRTGCSST